MFLITAGISHAQTKADIDKLGARLQQSFERGNPDVLVSLQQLHRDSKKIHYTKGIAQYYGLKSLYWQSNSEYKKALFCLRKSLNLYEELKLWNKVAGVCNNLGNLFHELKQPKQAINYYKKALAYYRKTGDKTQYASTCSNIGANYHIEGEDTTALRFYNEAIAFMDSVSDPIDYANLLLNKGGIYDQLGISDSAEYYYDKALPFFERLGNPESLAKTYNNLGYHYEMLGVYKRALYYYHLSIKTAQKANPSADISSSLEGLMMIHNQLGNRDSTEYYYFELASLNERLFKERTDRDIQESEAKYNAEKARRDGDRKAADEKFKKDRITIWLLFTVITAIILLLIFWTILERKRRKIRQQMKLQEEEIDRMVRSQEVLAFQSQLEGEAQERRRIAQELHDRVGGLLATLHLHFEAFTEKNNGVKDSAPLKDLVKTAIQEVRTVSHNLEGIGQGTDLRLALEQLEKGLNSTGKLHLQLFYEADEAQLSTKLTGELYKIIQELVTNTLRHAKARNVTLQISQPDTDIQVIYEDDGIGFDPETIRRGMGLNGIVQRCRHLDGTCTIDSRIGKGSTIIIQIPLQTL